MTRILKTLDSHVIRINGVEDHVHIIHTLPRTRSIAELIREVKKKSTKYIKLRHSHYDWIGWQNGFASFSAHYANLDELTEYVENQKLHHASSARNSSFQSELIGLLTRHGVEFDLRYLFPPDPEVLAA
ncbi:hypothetical protein A3850_010085 [Lewinella sp. 4G2]|nr:hypothetical protein A3850_010085 [Lewinella sp. 4G2]